MQNKLKSRLIADYSLKFDQELIINNSNSLGGGCINNAIKLETNFGDFFLKWNSSGPNDLFIREEESLNEFNLNENEFITFPKPLLSKQINELPGYLLTTFLPSGRSGNDDEKLGRGLAKLHQTISPNYGFKSNNYCGATLQNNSYQQNWIEFYSKNRIDYLIHLISKTRGWSTTDYACSDKFLLRIPHLLTHTTQPSLIHGDLWSGNYMYSRVAPALIDPCVSYCDREFEMGIMTMFGGFSQTVYDAYNEYYPLPLGWKERNQIYQLYHVLNHYYLFGGHYKTQALDIMKRFV